MILAHEQDDAKYISFSLKIQLVHAKMNSYFNLMVYNLIVYKNTRATYSRRH